VNQLLDQLFAAIVAAGATTAAIVATAAIVTTATVLTAAAGAATATAATRTTTLWCVLRRAFCRGFRRDDFVSHS
jgi:hypothetical protein